MSSSILRYFLVACYVVPLLSVRVWGGAPYPPRPPSKRGMSALPVRVPSHATEMHGKLLSPYLQASPLTPAVQVGVPGLGGY